MKGKLIIVSYRLPYRFSVVKGKLRVTSSSGGLATALHSFFEQPQADADAFGAFHWVGVSDVSRAKFERATDSRQIEDKGLTLHPVFIEGRDNDLFYNGFCNAVLWPLFHYFPSYVIYDSQYFEVYKRVNQLMADAIVELYSPGDTVWIHDYHFMLLPAMLRQKLPDANVGFFLHIPFPAFELFRILPRAWRTGILKGLLGSDVIGFHTEDYASHFSDSVSRTLHRPTREGIIRIDGREVLVRHLPISIDVDKFQNASVLPAVKGEVKKIKNRFGNNTLVLSVDRLDYTKAIINRLESFELFLKQNLRYRGKVTYLLLLVPTRDGIVKYRENKRQVEVLISRINGMYGSLTWTPIIYQHRSVDFKKLVALYSAADIALITPVRDGMNLVAKEFVSSRAHTDGVLILSETTGSASELQEALIVNPYDRQEISAALLAAVQQPLEEQRQRMGAMQAHLRQHDVHHWVQEFMQQLAHEPVGR